ncbi:MAG: MurR/RpiR family transcriptional regulator [Acidimicrobiales bacterium]
MPDLATRITTHADALPPAERRVAEVVLADPALAAFATVAELGREARTSGATVVRLADRLGYDGWVGLQAEVRASIDQHLRPATQRIREHDGRDVLAATARREADNVHRTLDAVDRVAFERAVAVVADRRRTVRILAGSAQDGIGSLLADDLDLLRPGVVRVEGSPVRVASRLAPTQPGDVLVAVDLRRYERWVLEAAAVTVRAEGVVVALTDSSLSPLARHAEVAFVVTAEGAGPFDSHVGTLALANALVTGVAARLRKSATERLDRVEAAWQSADALTDA